MNRVRFQQVSNNVGMTSHDLGFFKRSPGTNTNCTSCSTTVCPTTDCQTTQQNACTHKGVGKFVRLQCNKLGFKVMYVVKESDDCCVEKVTCEVLYSVLCAEDKGCVSYSDLYYIEYVLPDMINTCSHIVGDIAITITEMSKLDIFRYEGKIRRYTSCCGDIYFIELADTHEVRILNPDMLMPKRESRPTNEGASGCDCCSRTDGYVDRQKSSCGGICPERTTHNNNFTNFNKVIIQGFSLDKLTSCECEKRYLHIHDFCYYGRRC
ncbi:hypothetical protein YASMINEVIRUS_208 [Yasminevirus sp. GU-2018]|uniref:Uncharacterized protein n=1 Tax=Yasminevirus sp. GU-2018 TaxID=2420051 RepID=A0A5K0U7K8_9VIRU|nr:hypothetical protein YASMINEVIRUS_208 [Yasminevirus sp. GU-2018]